MRGGVAGLVDELRAMDPEEREAHIAFCVSMGWLLDRDVPRVLRRCDSAAVELDAEDVGAGEDVADDG